MAKIMRVDYYKDGDKTNTSAILLLSPPLAKAAAVFYTAAAYFKQLFYLMVSV